MMKHPVVSALIAFGVVVLGLVVAGMFTSGETRIEAVKTLDGPPERVWPFFADLSGWPVWYRAEDGSPRMTSSVLTQGTASGLNAVRHAEDSIGYWWEEKVTAFERERLIELTGTTTPERTGWKQVIRLEPAGPEKTKVTWTLEYSVKGPIVKLLNKSRNEEDFAVYMNDGMENINPLIPTAAEWGPADAEPPKQLFTPGKLETISAKPEAGEKAGGEKSP